MIRWAGWLAWRDARADRRRLAIYLSTIVAGVAALVAVRSFADNLEAAVDVEARTLLGADLEIYSRRPFDGAAEELLAEIGGTQARQVQTSSMASFPLAGATRLVTVRAVEPGFPFYGELETLPAGAAAEFPRPGSALVDSTLMLQFGVEVGDPVRIGELELRIAGRLLRIPGEVPTASLVGPRVFIPLQQLPETELIRPGSRARYSAFFRLSEPPEQVSRMVEARRDRLRAAALEAETVEYRRRLVGRGLENLGRFLYLAGFAALLLGGIGVASSMHLYARSKVAAVATLRCVGAPPAAPVLAFALQAVALGTLGAGLGAVLGVLAQRVLPWSLAPFLPVDVDFGLAPGAIAEGLVTGVVVALLFALLPLVSLRRVSPSAALRAFVDASAGWRDPAAWGIAALATSGLAAVATYGSGDLRLVGWLLGGLAAALIALAAVAALTRAGVRRLLPPAWPFVLRQGLANLYRPRNQTLVVLLSLGFGVFLLGTIYLTQAALLGAVSAFGLQSDANLVVFDVQPDQRAGVEQILRGAEMPVLQTTPVVPMRLERLEGRPVAEIEQGELPLWLVRREYNSTYRSRLETTETLDGGEWIGAVADYRVGAEVPVPVSLEADMAADLALEVGDAVAFNVQGIVIDAYVASLRRVDWEQVRPNFFVVFPEGVLESAPQQIVVVSRTASESESATVQRQLVSRFSNLSILDLALVFQTIDGVVARVELAIRTIALFCVAAGFGVLVVAVAGARQERVREAVLLRTLGASRGQILAIGVSEYLLLGALAGVCGLALAVAGAASLAVFVFDTPVVWSPLPLAGLLAITSLATTVVGLWGSRGVTTHPPLEVLRSRR